MVKPDRELYEPPYDDALMYDTVEEPQGPRGRPLIVLLGIVVLAAFAGVVWVAYNQGVKEGQRSNPPILSADSGPTRITPEAQSAPTPTDKTLARLSGETDVPPSEEQIMPQPEEPRPLPSPQEVTTTAPASPTRMTAPPAPVVSAPASPPVQARIDSDHPGLDTTVSPVSPLPTTARHALTAQTTHAAPPASGSEDLTSALPPSEDISPVPATTPKPAKPAKPKPVAAAVPSLPSLPPAMTSTTTVASGEGGPLVTSKPTETASLDPAQPSASPAISGAGPIAIQLGSFPTDLLAAASWSKIKSANAAVLGEYSPKFHRAEVEGKGTWYRLQVTGFTDKAVAQDVCNKLKANGQACIITTAK